MRDPARLRESFERACELQAGARAAFLDEACRGDPELREEVEALLRADAEQPLLLGAESRGDVTHGGAADAGSTADLPASAELRGRFPDDAGSYTILRRLGEGGMGEVYLAEQLQPVRRRVAIKLLRAGAESRELAVRFEAERQALALLNHPSIAKVFDAGAGADGRPYFVMEYVPGIPISEYCDRGRLSTGERLDLFIAVCEAVQHAHFKGIIHRDLKPANILVTDEDSSRRVPKVIDFGIAKALHQRLTERTLATGYGQVIGTPAYMSPEQIDPTNADVDTRTDIYSLGLVLYELLVGALPFPADAGIDELRRAILEVEPPKPSTKLRLLAAEDAAEQVARLRRSDVRSLRRSLRRELDWMTLKALEKDRSRRYASAADFAADVRRYLRNEPVLAGPPSTAYRLRKLVRRRRWELSAAAVVVAALSFVGTLSWGAAAQRAARAAREKSCELIEIGRKAVNDAGAQTRAAKKARERWKELEETPDTWRPVWERGEEVAAWKEGRLKETEANESYGRAVAAFSQAAELAPEGSAERTAALKEIEALYRARHDDAVRSGAVMLDADYYRAVLESLYPSRYPRELERRIHLRLSSEPAAAEVYCFRYKTFPGDERLLPIPFRPPPEGSGVESGFVSKPFLEVDEVYAKDGVPFLKGDRLLAAGGREVQLPADLPRAVHAVRVGERVPVRLRRIDTEITVEDWVPFPKALYPQGKLRRGDDEFLNGLKIEAGRVVGFLEQFAFTVAGYPLNFAPACRLGATGGQAPLEVKLPAGSYLLVLRKEGFLDARLPVASATPVSELSVRLFRREEVPEGFVHVPAGPFGCGGDPEAFQSLERAEPSVGDFFISRYELTVGEYVEFAQDPEVAGTFDAKSIAAMRALDSRCVLFGLSYPEILAYIEWRNRREGKGFTYRLASDLEWEKAARGADRRTHVWGDYLVWSFCRSQSGILGENDKGKNLAGLAPADESVYGVRDLAGSLQELTSDQPLRKYGYAYVSQRGGHVDIPDRYMFRIATRNSLLPDTQDGTCGIRLVAQLRERTARQR